MHLKKITLNNYRCFENLEVELHPRLTVLVGENGAGKTAILDGIAAGLSPLLRYLSSANQRLSTKGIGIKDTDFRIESWVNRGEKERWGKSDYAQIIMETTTGLQWDYWQPSSLGKKPSISIGDSELSNYIARILDSFKRVNSELLPVFSYYGAQRGRIEIPKRLHSSEDNYDYPTSALIDALNSLSNFKEMLKWFDIEESNELRANKGGMPEDFMESPILASVRHAIEVLLGGVYRNPQFDKNHKFVLLSSEDEIPLQVSQLSQGYQSMLALGMDFARRLALANRHLKYHCIFDDNSFEEDRIVRQLINNAHELGWRPIDESESFPSAPLFAPSIMLVDEIDLHLHPSWQQRVLDDLMRTFPGTQFIVTTHSPQVLTTVRKENIRVIQQTDEGYVADMPTMSPLARESGDALAYIQDTSVRPPLKVLEKIYDYEQIVRDGLMDSDRGREMKSELDEAGYEIPEADLALWQFLGKQAGKIKP